MMSILKRLVLTLRQQWLEKWHAILVEEEESKYNEDIALQRFSTDLYRHDEGEYIGNTAPDLGVS
jgi:hypothetical protein